MKATKVVQLPLGEDLAKVCDAQWNLGYELKSTAVINLQLIGIFQKPLSATPSEPPKTRAGQQPE